MWNENPDSLTFEDVRAFCAQQIPESHVLEYKESKPADLAKQLCAFANTLGGLIIIGVKEVQGNTGIPEEAPEGIQDPGALLTAVNQIAFTGISPPVSCKAAAIDNKLTGKGFVVIRVDPTFERPHCVTESKNSRIYVRTGDVSQPVQQPGIDAIRDLLRGREEALSRLRTVHDRARGRLARALCEQHLQDMSIARVEAGAEFSLTPRLPPIAPLDHERLRKWAWETEWTSAPGWRSHMHDYTDPSLRRLTADGVILEVKKGTQSSTIRLADVTVQGTHVYWSSVIDKDTDWEKGFLGKHFALEFDSFIRRLTSFLIASSSLYQALGFQMELNFRMSLHGLDKLYGPVRGNGTLLGDNEYRGSLDDYVSFGSAVTPAGLLSATPQLASLAGGIVGRCFNAETACRTRAQELLQSWNDNL